MRRNRSQPKYDVIDNLREVSTSRKLRKRFVNEWLAYFEKVSD